MKKLIPAFIIILFSSYLFSTEVDIDEISKSKKVNFINYKGKITKSESVSEIKSIGYRLGYQLKKGEAGIVFRYHMKYSVVRALCDDGNEKFSADIFFIDKDARVDHIRNIRRIIAAYLEGMYNYTEKEANAIAVYTTYYNAIYRGNLDYFSSKYCDNVMKYINNKKAGLSTLYSDWPGKTAIIIPLTEENKRGEIDSIDPFVISDEKVKEEISKDNEDRKTTDEIVKIKEKEIDKSKKDLEEDRKKLDENKKETQEERKKIEEKKTETEKKKDEIKKEKEETEKIKDPEKKKQKEEEIKKKEEELNKEEKKIKEEEKKIEKKEEKVKEEEKKIEKKDEEIKKKEEDVKKDKTDKDEKKTEDKKEEKKTETEKDKTTPEKEKELKKKEEELKKKEKELEKIEDKLKDKKTSDNVFGLKIYYLEVKEYLEGGHYNNEMYMINTQTKKVEFKSPVKTICGRRYDVFSGGIAVITHLGSHKIGHRLTILDREKLEITKTGEDNIFWRSFIEIRDNKIYAIIKADDDTFYLGKFDTNLKLIAKSKEKIHENTFITFFDKYIYINRDDKTIIVLNEEDLSLSDVIKP